MFTDDVTDPLFDMVWFEFNAPSDSAVRIDATVMIAIIAAGIFKFVIFFPPILYQEPSLEY